MSPWRPLPGSGDAGSGDAGSGDANEGARGERAGYERAGYDGRQPRPVGDSLPELARKLGAPAPSVLTAVFTRWEEIVGPSVAANAWPMSLSRGVLVVGVDHPGWASQLRFMVAEVAAKVAALTGAEAVDRVEIKVLARRPGEAQR